MGGRWPADQVLALAPDASSITAGQKLATTTPWMGTGATETLVWGLCKGSGKTPYRTIVDIGAPAYKCSCPSRKFPCKHALGLLLLWSKNEVPDAAEPADYAAAWQAGRADRATKKSVEPSAPKDPDRAAKTAAQRVERVRSGIDELQLWLTDQVGNGLAGAEMDAYRRFDAVAARLVDAQAPGLATRVRRLPALFSGVNSAAVDWPARLLEDLGRLWSLSVAHQRLDELPGDLAATVRRHVGYPTAKADVLATDGIADTWLCVGRRDADEDGLQSRRTWLWGATARCYGMVLDYAPTGATLPLRPVTGEAIATTMHFYPGAPRLRCVYDDTTPPSDAPVADPVGTLEPMALTAARHVRSSAIADDPWAPSWPVLVCGRLGRTDDATPALIDADTTAVPLTGLADRWPLLLALTGGIHVVVFGDLGPQGLDVVSVLVDGMVIGL
ncbi:SWIM zinc finger family protein [Gordonia oryzae]|uniref:SWIM zinc finger family protein n=1 Tax=Gordonia oryzae TaxID=2487349 RepID=A0A3N4H2J3_9ACTN|nr:SWIM zinc finger family protein [Gordonia oryzae]RPA59384.1 SWIM zinc finger family protein [Gordonia oryzae]